MRTRETTDTHRRAWSRQLRPERHRERVLAVLQARELPVSLSELADALLDQAEPPQPLATRSDVDAERLRVRLHHVDLPKLANSGKIEYDASNHVVTDPFQGESE